MKLSKWDMPDSVKIQENVYTYLQVAFEEGNAEDIMKLANGIIDS